MDNSITLTHKELISIVLMIEALEYEVGLSREDQLLRDKLLRMRDLASQPLTDKLMELNRRQIYPDGCDPLDELVPGYPPQEPREPHWKAQYPDDAWTSATEIPVGDEQYAPEDVDADADALLDVIATGAPAPPVSYNIDWYERDGAEPATHDRYIDGTQVDELNDTLIWGLFAEFGHTRTDRTYYEYEEVAPHDDPPGVRAISSIPLDVDPVEEAINARVTRMLGVRCPECLSVVTQEELDTFGGLCEECHMGLVEETRKAHAQVLEDDGLAFMDSEAYKQFEAAAEAARQANPCTVCKGVGEVSYTAPGSDITLYAGCPHCGGAGAEPNQEEGSHA